jgi:hypothetical protein
MIPNRESSASRPNADLRKTRSPFRQTNIAWLAEHGLREGVLLLGGASLIDFRQRVAQSGCVDLPSYWSLCGLLVDDGQVPSVPPLCPIHRACRAPMPSASASWPTTTTR